MPAKKQQFNYKIIWITRRKLVYTVALAVLGLAIVGFAIYPQIQESFALNTEYNREEPKVEKLQAKLKQLQSIDSTEEFLQKDLVNSSLPSKKPLLEFLTSLNSIAVANNITVGNFELSPGAISTDSADTDTRSSQQNASVDTLDLELEIEGSLDQLQQFLLDIEKISPFTTITKLSLGQGATAADRETDRTIQAKLSTSTYFFTQSIKATIDAPLPSLTALDRNVLTALSEFQNYDLPVQTEIVGGGVEDPFGVNKLQFLSEFGSALDVEDIQQLESLDTETIDLGGQAEDESQEAQQTQPSQVEETSEAPSDTNTPAN
jgi:Tfp pilus assembly protein PilO